MFNYNIKVFSSPFLFLDNSSNILPFTFRPFGGGPRICIGQRFAMAQIKLASAILLDKMKFVKTDKTTLEYVPGDMFLLQAKELLAKVEMR